MPRDLRLKTGRLLRHPAKGMRKRDSGDGKGPRIRRERKGWRGECVARGALGVTAKLVGCIR